MTDVSVLKTSSIRENHGPEMVLDFKPQTFYVSNSRAYAELRFELRYPESLSDIWIMTGTYTLSPYRVTIMVLTDKIQKKYETLVDDVVRTSHE